MSRHTTAFAALALQFLIHPATAAFADEGSVPSADQAAPASEPSGPAAPAFLGSTPDGGGATPDGGVGGTSPPVDGGADGGQGGSGSDGGPGGSPPPSPAPELGAAAATVLEPGADRRTGVRGRIGDRKTGQPLGGAPVSAKGEDGNTRTAITDGSGAFQMFIPPGSYTLRSHFNLHHGARMPRVPVVRGAFAKVNLLLDPLDVAEDVVVQEIEIPYRADTTTVAAQDQIRKESRGIGEGMGAQQMSQTGASDAGSAARRVVGVTIESNQLVVRGLGGRYVRVSLNGLPVPNTDPDFPSVDLDLFPTNVIDNLNIQKVFLPDIPADFAGGALDITTVSFPRKFFMSANVGTAYNSESTFRKRLSYNGGSRDWLGFDDGTRALPGVTAGQRLTVVQGAGSPFPNQAALDAAGDQFGTTWNYQRTTGLPQMGLNFAMGDAIKLPKQRRFGYLASVVYDYASERQVGVTRPRPGSTPEGDAFETSRYDVETGNTSVQLTAIGTASLDLGINHSLTALTMFNRSMDDQTRYRLGVNAEVDSTSPYESWQLRFLARTMLVNQLLGDHRNLGGTRLRLRWSGFYSFGQREEPDQRVVAYGLFGGIPQRFYPSATRLWSDLGQKDVGGTAQLRFPLWPEAWGTVGGRAVFSDRTFLNRRFRMDEHQLSSDPTLFTDDAETLFGREGLGTLTRISEATKTFDSYESTQRSLSGFVMIETPIFGPLSASGGARIELFSQDVASKSPFPQDNTAQVLAMNRTNRTDTNVLPGAALKYSITSSMLLRAAYGMTVSRPQVRELAPYEYYDFLRDRTIVGNPALRTTTIHNADLRWEWFFGEGQVAAVSAFHKTFFNPIELQIINVDKWESQYRNAKGATSLGTEFELRSELASLTRALRWFSVGGNLSLIRSQIDLEESGATLTKRRLAGQAPYVINLSLRFNESDMKLSLALIYNVVGPRITDIGVRIADNILPNVEEQAFHSLDFVGSWGVGKHLKLKFRVRNLLLQNRVLKQGSLIAQDLKPGMTVSLGIGYDY